MNRKASRYIDADELKNKVLELLPSDPCGIEEREYPFETDIIISIIQMIEETPSISIVHCGEQIDHTDDVYAECPFCGAKMKGEKNDSN